MRFMVIVKASKESEAGVMPSQQLLDRHGKLQRAAREGGRDAGRRRAASQLERRPHEVLGQESDRDRWPVRRNEGADRGLLDLEMRLAWPRRSTGSRRRRSTAAKKSKFASSLSLKISGPNSRPSCASRKSGWRRKSLRRSSAKRNTARLSIGRAVVRLLSRKSKFELEN